MLIQMRTVAFVACCLAAPAILQTGYGRASAELLENDPNPIASSEGHDGGKEFAKKKVSREVLIFDYPQEMIAHVQF